MRRFRARPSRRDIQFGYILMEIARTVEQPRTGRERLSVIVVDEFYTFDGDTCRKDAKLNFKVRKNFF